jgi:hypothetical protein
MFVVSANWNTGETVSVALLAVFFTMLLQAYGDIL